VLLARYRAERADTTFHDATRLLERLLPAAEDGARRGSVIEVLVLQALAHQARRDVPAALAPLRRALTLAEPEGSVRVFVDEGAPMAALLRALGGQGGAPSQVRQLLAVLEEPGGKAPGRPGLVDPLSARELDVLRLLGSDLDGPAIARELFVSLNTVRTHTKAVYAKLGVNNRRAAVRRAEELDLMSHARGSGSRGAVVRDR
jgi:LuxR family maltose regulon positive regulatory protein